MADAGMGRLLKGMEDNLRIQQMNLTRDRHTEYIADTLSVADVLSVAAVLSVWQRVSVYGSDSECMVDVVSVWQTH